MKVQNLTKREIISKILHYDSRFFSCLKTLQGLKKNVLINVYCFVFLNYISDSFVDCFCSCLSAKEFLND